MRGDLEKDYFALFALPRSFDIDPQDLASRYRKLQRQTHPDKFIQALEQERQLSMQVAARVNEAFQILKDPLTRARYLLQLTGVDTGEETDTRMDPAFLAEQMELRERLAEIGYRTDVAAALSGIHDEICAGLRTRVEGLRAMLSDDEDSARIRARDLVREMQFLRKLLKEVEDRQEAVL